MTRFHLKNLKAGSFQSIAKLDGVFTVKPLGSAHRVAASLPLLLLLRNRLKYALVAREARQILMQRLVQVDGRVRTSQKYGCGFMDVISIPTTNEQWRILYDVKGRFALHKIVASEAKFKLCKVTGKKIGRGAIPYITTHDGRTIRYPDPDIKLHDSIKIDIATGKIIDFVHFKTGNSVMVTSGRNIGRVGLLQHRDRHPGGFDIVHVVDDRGHSFATRMSSVFVIGEGNKPLVSLPKRKGIKMSILEERERRVAQQQE